MPRSPPLRNQKTLIKFLWHSWLATCRPMNWVWSRLGNRVRVRAWHWRPKIVTQMRLWTMKILKWNPTSQGNSKSSWRTPMRKDLRMTESNPVLHNSKAMIKGRRMLGMAINTMFPLDQSASDIKVLGIWNKNVQPISRPLGKAKPLLLPWVTLSLRIFHLLFEVSQKSDKVEK